MAIARSVVGDKLVQVSDAADDFIYGDQFYDNETRNRDEIRGTSGETDTILDFTVIGDEQLQFYNRTAEAVSDFKVSADGGGTLIELGNWDLILPGVAPALIDAGDFAFPS